MTVLSRYVLAQALRPMGAIILVALIALLAERAVRVVNLVVGWRGSVFAILEMLGYLVPHYMGFALPAALFLGVFMATARMAREGELDALQAGGVGIWRYTRPLIGLSFLLIALHMALVGYLQPYSRYAYRAAVFTLTNVSFQTLLEPRVFTTLGRTTYLVQTLDADKERFRELFLYSEGERGEAIVISAAEGRIVVEGATRPVLLRLRDGVQQVVPGGREVEGEQRLPTALTVRFREFTTDLRGTEPIGFRPRGQDERELTLDELVSLRGQSRPGIRPAEIAAELDGRLVRSLSIPFLPLLAVPLALGRRRGRRSYGFVVGILLVVGYSQILQTGEALADDGMFSTFTTLWLPFSAFAALSVLLFLVRATRVPDPARGAVLDRLFERTTSWLRRRYDVEAA